MSTQLDLQPLYTFAAIISFVAGGMIGSFLNVCVYRLPRKESIVKPRSHCPKCGKLIAWYDNVPILSWVLLRGKCRHCEQSISRVYPLVEAITATLFLFVFWRFGFTFATPVYMALSAALVLVTFVDLTDWTIPNEVTLPGIPIGLGLAVVAMVWPGSNLVLAHTGSMPAVFDALLGTAIGGASLYMLDKVSLLLLGKRGMGFGDVKLLAMLGAFLGWKNVLLIIMISSCLGSVVGVAAIVIERLLRKRNQGAGAQMPQTAQGVEAPAKSSKQDEQQAEPEHVPVAGHYLPFGPYLAAAGLIVIFFGEAIFDAYYNFITAGNAPADLPF